MATKGDNIAKMAKDLDTVVQLLINVLATVAGTGVSDEILYISMSAITKASREVLEKANHTEASIAKMEELAGKVAAALANPDKLNELARDAISRLSEEDRNDPIIKEAIDQLNKEKPASDSESDELLELLSSTTPPKKLLN